MTSESIGLKTSGSIMDSNALVVELLGVLTYLGTGIVGFSLGALPWASAGTGKGGQPLTGFLNVDLPTFLAFNINPRVAQDPGIGPQANLHFGTLHRTRMKVPRTWYSAWITQS